MADQEMRQEFESLLSSVRVAALRFLGRYAQAHVAEDLFQQTSVDAWKAFAQFRKGSSFKAWFFRIAFNNFLDWRRGAKHEVSLEDLHAEESSVIDIPDPRPTPDELALIGWEMEGDIFWYVALLPKDQRAVLCLYFIAGYSYEEIAELLGIPVNTVRTRLYRGRMRLARLLGKEQKST